jgi:hypothetical protein
MGENQAESDARRFAVAEKRRQAFPESLKAFEDAHAAYLKDLAAVWEATRKACASEAETYSSACRDASRSQDPKGATAAWERYVGGLRTAWTESQRGYEEAYRTYTRAVRDAFSRLEEGTLDPRALSMVAAATASAAQYAASTIGNWSMLFRCGVDPRLAPVIAAPPAAPAS